ncbi:efflux RND transporter permease subunit [Paludibacterium yongneupense]|uniref:efflux RND transporter permease subunit n=1 Tax=Paludibacterium yongneupense TaxID=400061 RepID=UPI00040F9B1E|nr:efflux RND transporter permease subunit [Paludibacterium yongneupense]
MSGREDGGAGFNLSAWAVRHQGLVIFILLLATLFGMASYGKLSRSEDPPFTFKVMVVRTLWPGATARQMQLQVSDRIGRTLQEIPGLDFLNSVSRPGESLLFVNLKESTRPAQVPDSWYQIRKKVGDMAATLPDGVQGPFFNDEFGDVYANLFVLQGDGFSPAQLHDYGEQLRTELLRVPHVGKVTFFGDQEQRIHLEIDNQRLARLGVSLQQVAAAIAGQNTLLAAGLVTTPDDKVYLRPDGALRSEAQLAGVLLRVGDKTIRLGDIARIERGYADPPGPEMRYQQRPALGIGVSLAPGGNVTDLGRGLDEKVRALREQLPAGLQLREVASMPQVVESSVDEFVEAVGEAVAIVLAVSLFSLGLRTGTIVVITIPLVLAVTVLCMRVFDIGLNKVSLGTLILALGLLVDDAIIAIEMMAVKLREGLGRAQAAAFAYVSTAFPMLTGTLVTVSGFLPIALAQSDTGEYTRSIFEVSAISLLVSWLAAVIVVPVLGYRLLPAPSAGRHDGGETGVYDTPFYRRLRGWVGLCIDHKGKVLLATVLLFGATLLATPLVRQQFFPSSDRSELLIDMTLPDSASHRATLAQVRKLETYLARRPEIDHYIDFVGEGAPRFYLPLDQQLAADNVAQFVVTCKSVRDREKLAAWLDAMLPQQFSAVRTRTSRLETGPPVGYPVQFRVSGPDARVVREQALKVAAVIRQNPDARNIQLDWDEPGERSMRFEIDQNKARALNVSSRDIADFLQMTLSAYTVGQLREGDKLIAIEVRAPAGQRADPARIINLSMPAGEGRAIPLAALGQMRYGLEYAVIRERDRQPTITVRSDLAPAVQSIDATHAIDRGLAGVRSRMPPGYRVEIGGAVEASAKADASIVAQLPLLVAAILLLLMIQLQRFSLVSIVVLTAPLGLIGVIPALLLFRVPLGFVAMLGIIAMAGIIMRNSVILVDQIEQDIRSGHERFDAIVESAVRRFRPIMLTAAAAVLALIPLLASNFFSPMATALMGGITTATVLTLFYLPALYAIWFGVRRPPTAEESS